MRKDVLFGTVTNKYDLLIRNGDFVIEDSDWQHTRHILEATPGQYRKNPLVGIGIRSMINGPLTAVEKRTIKLQLEADKINVNKIEFSDSTLIIE